jgi:3-methyl-2-oxobutanoate hydroxymethyltransferase
MTPGKAPKFSKNFMQENHSIESALRAFVDAVHNQEFPQEEHCFQ